VAVVWWRERRSELLKFGVIGGLAFVVDLGLFNLLHYGPHPLLEDRIVTAKIVSAVAATVVSWIGNRMWTFRKRRTDRPIDELLVFALINVVALLIPVVTVAFTAYVLELRDAVPTNIAAVVGIGIGTIARYIGYRRFVFTDASLLRARLFRALCASPDWILLLTVSLAIACAATVSLGVFRPWTALPLAAVLAAGGWRLLPARRPTASDAQGARWLLVGVSVWFTINLPFIAEYLIVRRDPGFLTLSGMWLIGHPSTDISTDGAMEAAAALPHARAEASEAWNLNGDIIQPQGAKLLPALIAMGGWVGGTTGVMTANLVIGAVGLVAVYVLAREALGPIAALVPAIGVSMTVSHIWLSRAAYTESITMLLLVAAIAWAWRGVKEARAGPLFLAAIASGTTMFARIDGAVFAIGVLAGVTIALLGSRHWSIARRGLVFAGFAATQALVIAAGYASLWRWSRAYIDRLSDEAGTLAKWYFLFVGAAVVAALTVVAFSLHKRQIPTTTPSDATDGSRSGGRVSRWLTAGGITAAFVVLASRPLWMTGHGTSKVPSYIEFLQTNAGEPVDATRTYAESTVTWMSYYLTWPLLALGIIGFAVMAWKWASGEHVWAVPIAAFLAPTVFYLLRPSIVPDQAWAIRRLSSAGITGLIIAAAFAWVAITRWLYRRKSPRTASVASTVIAASIAIFPVLAWCTYAPGMNWSPIIPTSAVYLPEQMGARNQVDILCSYADGHPVILAGTSSHFGTIRVSCEVPVVLVQGEIYATNLREASAVWEEAPVVLTEHPENVPWTTTPSSPTFEATARYATGALLSLPVEVSSERFHWYVGNVLPDGMVEFVPPPRGS